MSYSQILNRIESLKQDHPQNASLTFFDRARFEELSPTLRQRLLFSMRSGIEYPDSQMGFYASHTDDYKELADFFGPAIISHHAQPRSPVHVSDWTVPEGAALDLNALGLPSLSCRIRVARNFADLPMPSTMTAEDRRELETRVERIFQSLAQHDGFEGTYHSLTPGHREELSKDQYLSLQQEHIMFGDMSTDRFLTAAGIASHWPEGRGCYLSNNRNFIVWVGEEDHLRIMVMENTARLTHVLKRLEIAVNEFEQHDGGKFAWSDAYGYLTSCPTNLGTAMRASVHLPLPNLVTHNSENEVLEIAKSLGLTLRGVHGEHSSFGTNGLVDVSPSTRLWVSEGEIVTRLYRGIDKLMKQEQDYQ